MPEEEGPGPSGPDPTRPVLVTGGTGFLGTHLLDVLLGGDRDGAAPLRVLAREPAPRLAARGVEVVEGDLLEGPGLEVALGGVRAVFHLAGMVSRDPDAAARLQQVHVDGARRLAGLARAAGVERIVLVSTSGTIAVTTGPEPELEESAPTPIDQIGGWPYYRSKWLQERALLSAAEDLEVVVVNPSLLLGPGDERLSSTGDVLRFLAGEVRVIPPGGLNFVDVRDAAASVASAMTRGRPGHRYLLGGHNWSFADFFARLGEVSGLTAPRLRLPKEVYTAAALVSEEAARQLGREPAVDRISREMAASYWYFSSAKAERELGHTARDGRLTLLETVRWLDGRGLA